MLNRLKTKGAIAFFALIAIVLPACTNEQVNRPVAQEPVAQERENVTTEDVSENTKALIGKTVTIRSEPIRKVDPNAFTVSDEQFFGSEPILVVNASGQPFTLPEDNDTEVQVTGEVRNLVVADLNREYDLDLDPDLYVDYDNRPAIIAQSLAPAPEPGEISANPSQYYGRTLAVSGEVENVYSANTFTLDEDELFGGDDLLVVVRNAQGASTPIKVDQTVATTGVLREFVIADLEREYDFNWDEGIVRQLLDRQVCFEESKTR
jgi:hypothetical protein